MPSVAGPDILVIGWIPYYPTMGALPAGHFYPQSLANHLLFNSGNPEPAAQFANYQTLASTYYPLSNTGQKAYRAIIVMRDVTLSYKNNHSAPKIDFEYESYIGFTPPRFIVAVSNLSPFWPVQGIGPSLSPQAAVL